MTDITQADWDFANKVFDIAFGPSTTIDEEMLSVVGTFREAAFQAGVKAMQEAAAAHLLEAAEGFEKLATYSRRGNSASRIQMIADRLRMQVGPICAIDPTSIKDTQP